ncbi:MAG: GGDEF domain-containing protein, partial [bacterium]
AEAFKTAEEMRNKLKSSTVIYNGDELHVKISIGISEIRKTDQSSSEIIRRADQALYLSKERGRDQTTVI